MRLSKTIIILLGLQLAAGGIAPVLEAKETKRVLILYSQERGHPAHDLTEQGIRSAFLSNSFFEVQLYNEYLDIARFSGPAQISSAADYLRRKYSGMKIDAIIAVYPYAVDFLLAARSTLFNGVPIIACETSRSYAENLEHSPVRRFVTGTIVGDNMTDIIAVALRMRPETKRVALVAGTSPNDIYGEQVFRRGISASAKKIETIDLTKLSMAETLSRVGSLPPGTVIFYESILRDGAGKIFVPREALSLISRAANVPVFGIYDSFMGFGIVGGRLVSFERHGKEAAAIAIRVLSGESPAAIPFGGESAYVSLYDWRELERWNIPESSVSAEGVVLYKRFSLWDEHRWEIIAALFLIIAEGGLIFGLVMNLRERRKAERLLADSEERLSLAAVSAGAGIWVFDADTGIVWGTPQVYALLGLPLTSSVKLETVLNMVHPHDRNMVQNKIRDAMECESDEIFSVEYRIVLADGEIRWLVSNGRRQRSSHRQPLRLMGVTVDITERKKAETEALDTRKRLLHMQRVLLMGELAASIAHELNQPLTAILSNAGVASRILNSDSLDIDELKEIVKDISEDDRRASAIIRSLRSMVKMAEATRELSSINTLLTDEISLIRGEAALRDIYIEAHFSDGLPKVLIDATQIKQVAVNLLMNAVESISDTRGERRITVQTRLSERKSVLVAVRDTGRGFTEEEQKDLFEPFFTTKRSGLGVGLSLCRSIIESHGGR
ncbi:MAG TPA: ATP-binding protein, partial [Nitrospirota bacterium]|nr:ATP-binding protein [Nitrospirota bacterium]